MELTRPVRTWPHPVGTLGMDGVRVRTVPLDLSDDGARPAAMATHPLTGVRRSKVSRLFGAIC